MDITTSEIAINRLKGEIAQLTRELQEFEGKFLEEQKQLRQAQIQLETISCTVALVLLLVLITLWSLVVEVIFSLVVKISGTSLNKPTFSIASAVIFLFVFFLILIMNPARWLNRKRLEQLSATLNAKEDEYTQAKSRYEAILAKKKGELLHHQKQ